ncbi:MAG TPA: hypothetical protein VF648_20850 [Pyrinomonadaceae bacterium]|jgi:hypothetical protein
MKTKWRTKTKKISLGHLRLICAVIMLSLLCGSTVLPQRPRMVPGTTSDVERIYQSVDNGIFVDTAKVYDDSSLQLMLNAARLRLAALQSFDQSGLLSRIGAITGATLEQQSFSAQILGPPPPSTAVTSLGATGTTTTVNAPSGQTVTAVAGQPAQNVVTTTPQMTASVPSLPSNSASLPTSGFNVSSLDALNEMMQLTYEIANLQLLIEGSLSDRYVSGERLIKPRTTLGFPITVTTQERYKDAVAMVEIEVANPPEAMPGQILFSTEPPTVTALLPREKTYNVASITDKMTSVGGGIVTQVINGGFSYLRGRKSYYIVQDQDTLAMMHRASSADSTQFSWQFRPVLGQRYVRSGLKQTFVQLAAPLKEISGCFGNLTIKTYWRKYDRKRGVLKEVIADSVRVQNAPTPIPRFDLTPVIEKIDFQDLGSGVVQAALTGRFLPGTYVRIGNNFYREGSPGFTSELTQIRFVASAADVARHRAFLVTRDGTEIEIVDSAFPILLPALTRGCSLRGDDPAKATPSLIIDTPEITAYDSLNSILKITIPRLPDGIDYDKYVIVVGNKVFGLSDAPIERYFNESTRRTELKAIVPTNLLSNSTSIEVKPLFWREDFSARVTDRFKAENSPDKIGIYGQVGSNTVYLLYGNRLQNAKVLLPSGVTLREFRYYSGDASGPSVETLQAFELTPDQQVKANKQIVLEKSPGERPIPLSLPATVETDKKPVLTVRGGLPIPVGAKEIIVQGDNLDKLDKVTFNGKEITKVVSKDNKFVTLAGAGLTDDFSDKEIVFEFREGIKSTALKLEFANSKNKVSVSVSN